MRAFLFLLCVSLAHGAGLGIAPSHIHFNDSEESHFVILHNPNPWGLTINSSIVETRIAPHERAIVEISGISSDATVRFEGRHNTTSLETHLRLTAPDTPARPFPWKKLGSFGVLVLGGLAVAARLLFFNS
ncbi:MAG: hypothetical protein ACQESG_07335 [Nanobdellota archaeon]